MSVTTWKDVLIEIAAEHPLLAVVLSFFMGIALVLGSMHEGRIMVDCFIPFISHFKQGCDEWRGTWRRLKRELKAWKSDP